MQTATKPTSERRTSKDRLVKVIKAANQLDWRKEIKLQPHSRDDYFYIKAI
jgi:hypothetical protein